MKSQYDPGDLKNKIKVKLMTCNNRSCHYAFKYQNKDINIKFLSQKFKDLWKFVHSIGYDGKIQLQPIKFRNEDLVT